MQLNVRAGLAAVGMLGCLSTSAAGEEGMWTFDRFPAERMREQMGWAPDQAWLDRAMRATARIPGCSASNVSADGLILTNHHCVIACITALSSAEANFIEHGFMARLREEERRCPNFTVELLSSVADVTARIDAAAPEASAENFAHLRDAEIERIEGGCTIGAQRCEVVTLYQGGRYALHTFRVYDDVRLVFTPEHAMAAFGGADANFNFPRYSADFAFLRLYERGAPARTRNHLSLRFTPLEAEEVVLISGNPGPTSRLLTAAEVAFERDVLLPWRIGALDEYRSRLAVFAALGPDQARVSSTTRQSVENTYAGLVGRRQALARPEAMASITARETDLQARVHRNLAARREVGDAWGEIERAQAAYRDIFHAYQVLELRAGEQSLLFALARDIVRASAERRMPEADRLPRYVESRLRAIENGVVMERSIDPALEAVHLSVWLTTLNESLPRAQARLVLGDETPDALAQRLAQTRLADAAFRAELWRGGAAAVAASDDPMIAFIRAWDVDARAARAAYTAQVEVPVARARERIARARFRAFGEELYPEPTFSPRLSYGRVRGWTEANTGAVAPFTDLGGLYARAGAPPAAITPRWVEAQARLDPRTVLNISTSTDLTGGSSGSPLLDREGRVAGVVFDSNMHALGGEYFYDANLNRSISVSSTLIRTALSDVYDMQALLAELEE